MGDEWRTAGRLTLVRHGETTGQSSVRYYGATDVPLNDVGRAQMHQVRAALAGERFDAAFSSRMRRAVEGAAIVAAGQVAVTQLAAFDEINFGRWEGWTREEIATRDAENFRRWQEEGESFRYPDGDTRHGFRERVRAGLLDVLTSTPPGNWLMVLHKGVIAVVLTELLHLDPTKRAQLAIDLASIHTVAGENGQWHAQVLNRVDHLSDSSCAPSSPGSVDSLRLSSAEITMSSPASPAGEGPKGPSLQPNAAEPGRSTLSPGRG